MKQYFSVSLLFLVSLGINLPREQDMSTLTKRPPAAFGLNLAGAEFGSEMPGRYEKTYSYPGITDLDYCKAKGMTLIRLPFRWERIQPEKGGNLDAMELARMKKFVEDAKQRGVWVILDLHNYGRRLIDGTEQLIGSPQLSVADVGDVWRKLAGEFKEYDNIWGYGLMNEPHDMLTTTPWFTIAQSSIRQIRNVDSKTAIMVGGDSWSSAERWPRVSDNLKNLVDPANNLLFEAHIYFDNDASGAYKHSYDDEKASPTTGIERVKPFVNWLQTNQLKGFIGEYGVPDNDPRWLTTLDNFLQYIQANCIGGTYWAAGSRWGDYSLAVTPRKGVDRPQMQVLEKYKQANRTCQ